MKSLFGIVTFLSALLALIFFAVFVLGGLSILAAYRPDSMVSRDDIILCSISGVLLVTMVISFYQLRKRHKRL